MSERVRVGVVGVGSLGAHHARVLCELPEAELVGLFETRPDRAAEVAGRLNTRAYTSLESLLDAVDAITVAVPTSEHSRVATAALERGLDVLIEKPIASTPEEAGALVALAARTGCVIQVGHIERFNAAVRACEPYLGQPLFVESHRLAPFVPRGTDVPVVLDLMIHDIDLVLSLVHEQVRAVAAVGVPVLTRTVDIANARIEFGNGAVANITASRVSAERQRKIRFFQPSAYISLDLAKGRGQVYRRRVPAPAPDAVTSLLDYVEPIELAGDGQEPLRLEMEAFVRAVRRETPPAVSGAEAQRALKVAFEIIERIEENRLHVPDSTAT